MWLDTGQNWPKQDGLESVLLWGQYFAIPFRRPRRHNRAARRPTTNPLKSSRQKVGKIEVRKFMIYAHAVISQNLTDHPLPNHAKLYAGLIRQESN